MASSRDAKYFNVSEKYEMDQVCGKYEEPDAVREFIRTKAKEGVIKYWTHEKLYAFLAENGFRRSPKADKVTMDELARHIQEQCGITLANAHSVLASLTKCIEEVLVAGESITFQGFGSFKVVEQAARKGRNPQTGAEIDIPAKKAVKFTAAKALKDAVAGE